MTAACGFFLLVPITSLALNVLGHAICSRATGGGRHLTSILVGFIAGMLTQTVLAFVVLSRMPSGLLDQIAYLAMNTFMYVALAYGYFAFVNLNVTSLRIRILKELLSAGSEGLPEETLLSLYNPKEIFAARIRRLTNWKQLVEEHERYFRSGKSFWFATRTILFFKFILFRKPIKRPAPFA